LQPTIKLRRIFAMGGNGSLLLIGGVILLFVIIFGSISFHKRDKLPEPDLPIAQPIAGSTLHHADAARGSGGAIAAGILLILVGALVAFAGLTSGLGAQPGDYGAVRQVVTAVWTLTGVVGLAISAIGIAAIMVIRSR
jgi:hypothetical protein